MKMALSLPMNQPLLGIVNENVIESLCEAQRTVTGQDHAKKKKKRRPEKDRILGVPPLSPP
jgi:hypothetical protein